MDSTETIVTNPGSALPAPSTTTIRPSKPSDSLDFGALLSLLSTTQAESDTTVDCGEPLLLINWTKTSEGQILQAAEEGSEESAIMHDIIAEIFKDFDTRSEILFENNLAFHTTTLTVRLFCSQPDWRTT